MVQGNILPTVKWWGLMYISYILGALLWLPQELCTRVGHAHSVPTIYVHPWKLWCSALNLYPSHSYRTIVPNGKWSNTYLVPGRTVLLNRMRVKRRTVHILVPTNTEYNPSLCFMHISVTTYVVLYTVAYQHCCSLVMLKMISTCCHVCPLPHLKYTEHTSLVLLMLTFTVLC